MGAYDCSMWAPTFLWRIHFSWDYAAVTASVRHLPLSWGGLRQRHKTTNFCIATFMEKIATCGFCHIHKGMLYMVFHLFSIDLKFQDNAKSYREMSK